MHCGAALSPAEKIHALILSECLHPNAAAA
jgi:hypothetical protein